MSLWKFPVKRIAAPPEMDVRLTDEEDRICQLLDNYVKETQGDTSTRTVCRIAGGWVRDKVNIQKFHPTTTQNVLNPVETVTWLSE